MIDLVFDGMVAFSTVASVMLGAMPFFKKHSYSFTFSVNSISKDERGTK